MKNSFQKVIAYFFTMLFILLMMSIFLISCKAKQPIIEKQKTEIRIKDSVVVSHREVVSKGIIDSIKLYVGNIKTSRPDCDSITQNAITQLLMRIQTSKQSGDNGYELRYNNLLKQFEIIMKIADTKSATTTTSALKTSDIATEIVKPVLVEKPYNWFEKTLFGVATLALIFVGYKITSFLKSKTNLA